jgi:sugar/nucleoside kinase (ribokinase family)
MRIPQGDIDLLAIGETLIDFISEEVTESLLEAATFHKYQGGSPANIAVYAAKLGGKAAIISKVGAGAFGQFLKRQLESAGVLTTYLIQDPSVHTTIIFVSHTRGTPDFEAYRNGDFRLEPDEISAEMIARARLVHASTFALSRPPCRLAVEKAFGLARQAGKIISLDPNYSQRIWPDYAEARQVIAEMLGYATLTKPSLDDAQRLFGAGKTPEEYIELFHECGPGIVVLTMGAGGMILSAEGRQMHIPARSVKVVDATGAGDSFWAGFLTALLDGNSLERCALFAREVVERKLTTVGPLPGKLDRAAIYAALG